MFFKFNLVANSFPFHTSSSCCFFCLLFFYFWMLKAQNDNGNEQQYYTRTCHIMEMKTGIKWSGLQEWTNVFKNIKHVSQTFHEVEQTMQWFGLSLYSKSQWQKKFANLSNQKQISCLLLQMWNVCNLQWNSNLLLVKIRPKTWITSKHDKKHKVNFPSASRNKF